MKTRICPYCNEEKILNLENFYWRKNEKGRSDKWRVKCIECVCKGAMRWHHENYETKVKDKMSKRATKWRKNNKDKIKLREREKEKEDLGYKLKKRIRTRINNAIRFNTNFESRKDKRTLELLDVSNIEFVWKHLESKFKPGMTRENCGKWHIDHIVPCASFDLKCPVQQLACFHYSNLQPLWAKENLSKGAKIVSRDITSLKT